MAKRIRFVVWWGLAAFVLLVFSLGAGALMIRQRSLEAELAQARAAFEAGHYARWRAIVFPSSPLAGLLTARSLFCWAKASWRGSERAAGTQGRSAGGFERRRWPRGQRCRRQARISAVPAC